VYIFIYLSCNACLYASVYLYTRVKQFHGSDAGNLIPSDK